VWRPRTLLCIERAAFSESALVLIHLPSSVEIIGERCFADSQSLVSIIIPSSSRLSRLSDAKFGKSSSLFHPLNQLAKITSSSACR
jgi:hypothetical protein